MLRRSLEKDENLEHFELTLSRAGIIIYLVLQNQTQWSEFYSCYMNNTYFSNKQTDMSFTCQIWNKVLCYKNFHVSIKNILKEN